MRKRLAFGLVAAIVAIGFVIAARHELLRFAIQAAGSLASGYTVTIGDQRIGFQQSALYDVHVSHAGQPLLDARRIDVRYSPRDLLPGSTRRFGLVSIDVNDAKLTIVKFDDGTYNFIIPAPAAPGPPVPVTVDQVPIRFSLRMHGAALELREPKAYDASAKEVGIQDFNVDASVDSATVTRYRARGLFRERREEPFTIEGTIDSIRSFAMHRMRAKRFPLRALANYFADTPAVRILRGRARNFDARLFSLDVRPNVAPSYHANLQLDVEGGRLALSALDAPVDNVVGHLQLVDNAFFLRRVDATLAGIPLHVTGGIFDLTGALTGTAQLRLGIYGSGDLSALRKAFTFTQAQPVSGRVDLGVLVEGPIDNPLIVAHAGAARVAFQKMPFDRLQAGVIYHDNLVALLPLRAQYGGVDAALRGTLSIGKRLHSEIAVHVAGTTDNLPYLDEMLRGEPVLVDAAASGTDLTFHVAGAAASARGISRMAALFELEPNGTASVAPFWVHTERGQLDGGYALDRPDGDSGFWAVLGGMRMRAPAHATFPGIELPQIPPVDAVGLHAAVEGGGSLDHVALSGRFGTGRSTIAGVHFDRIDAAFSGTMTDATVNELHASGPWGVFDGAGAFGSQAFVARGAYRGTFEGLQPFLGDAIPGHGRLAGTVAIAVEPNRILVQGDRLSMPGATLRGVPVSQASLTLAVEPTQLRVYSARARTAGGDVVAAGTYSLAPHPLPGAGGRLSLVANRLDAAQLKPIGLPFDAGRLSASGDLAAGAPIPAFDGGVTVADGRMQQFPLAGSGDVRLAGDAAHLGNMIGALGPTYAYVNGTIGALSSGAPVYDIDADAPAGSIAGALHALHFPSYETEGSFNARLHVSGRGASPDVAGRIGVPAGDVNGLPFLDASGELRADPRGASFDRGGVWVGSTYASFGASSFPGSSAVHVAATHADLGDFNNFFDTGDTLAGRGRVKFAAAAAGNAITTSGDIDVAGLRYRNLPIGDTRATWSSARDAIRGSLAVGGSEGMLRAHGSIAVVPRTGLLQTFMDSRYDLTGTVSDLDLSLWVPALGYPGVPVSGRVSGQGTILGRYPQLALRGSAQLDGGTLGPLSLDVAKIAVHSVGTRVAIDSAQLVTPGLTATAVGSLGLRPSQPLDLQVHATSDDLPRLVYELAHVKVPVTGTFESTLSVGGTYRAPTFAAGVDATNVSAYGISIASLFGEVKLHGRTLELSNAGAQIGKGEATLAGSLPLQLSPLQLGPPDEPLSFDLDLIGVDPSIFDLAFGKNTKLGGTIEGHVGVSGTVAGPVVLGRLSLAGGSYVSDIEKTPIVQAAAVLAFDRTTATISGVTAKVGDGRVQASGRIEFPGGFEALSGYSFVAKGVARGAQLDLPEYGSGTIDADLALTKTPSTHALLSGSLALSNATLPFSAFVNAATQASTGEAPKLPPLAFDLSATAGKNVRVRGTGYGAGLDIGGAGTVRLGGTLAAPTLDGKFTSSGGTLTYFDRAFRVQEGSVDFDPATGLSPTIHAVATTSVVNPDPDRARNPYGSAQITIDVNGPISNLAIDFTSNPAGYSRDQIIAMIAPLGGFIGGVAFTNQSVYQVQSPGGFTPLGAVSPLPNGIYTQRNGTITVGQEAFNILNAQFAAGLLAPVETALGQGLGLSSVNVTLGYYGNVGVTATRLLGKTVSAIYATTFGLPAVQSFGIKVQPSPYTSATLSFFYQTSPTLLFQTPGTPTGFGGGELLGQPLTGQSGFSVNLKRYFGAPGLP